MQILLSPFTRDHDLDDRLNYRYSNQQWVDTKLIQLLIGTNLNKLGLIIINIIYYEIIVNHLSSQVVDASFHGSDQRQVGNNIAQSEHKVLRAEYNQRDNAPVPKVYQQSLITYMQKCNYADWLIAPQ